MDEENRLEEFIFFLSRGLAFLAVALVFAGVLLFASRADKYGIDNMQKPQPVESQPMSTEQTETATEPEKEDMVVGEMDDRYTISLSSSLPDDLYTLKYEDTAGIMDSYVDICALHPGESYDKLIMQNAAPQTAARIAVLNSDGEQVGHIPFAPSFRPNLGGKMYSFAVLSDVHIGQKNAENNLKSALTYLSRQTNVSYVCVVGDLTTECTDEQLTAYKSIVAQYAGELPVYAFAGDHDTEQYRKSNISDSITQFTGYPMYFSGTKEQDVYIFLGTYNGYDEGRIFSREQLQWLYEKLEANRNQRCFIFEHVRPDTTSGNPHDLQSVDLWDGTEATVFESLLKHYPNVTFFHGHSHTALALQEDFENANYDDSLGCHSVHIPALVGTRKLDQYGYGYDDFESSEGYIVDVYENSIVIRGFDFVQRKGIPIATYCLDTTIKTVEAGTYTDETMTINCDMIVPEWNYRIVIDTKVGKPLAAEDHASTELIPIEKDTAYFVHQYWECPYEGKVAYYDANGKFIKLVTVWDEEGYLGPVKLEIPENAAAFRIDQLTEDEEVQRTKDIFVTCSSASTQPTE